MRRIEIIRHNIKEHFCFLYFRHLTSADYRVAVETHVACGTANFNHTNRGV